MDNLDLNLLLKEINDNEQICKFIKENNLTKETINKNLTSFLAYLTSEKKNKGVTNRIATPFINC